MKYKDLPERIKQQAAQLIVDMVNEHDRQCCLENGVEYTGAIITADSPDVQEQLEVVEFYIKHHHGTQTEVLIWTDGEPPNDCNHYTYFQPI
jgi:uncharacterized protein with von Willebrand factor type A (vWA) domain